MSASALAGPARHFTPLLRWSAAIVAAVIGGVAAFELLDVSVFKRIGLPHEYCYQQDPKLVWLHVTADALIGLAYVSISATLAFLVFRASRDIPFHGIFLAFGLFIVSCGMTHFMEVWVIWEPVYWLSGYVKVVTAAASVATAVALFPLLPKVFRLIETARASERRRVEIEQLNGELERFNYTVAHDLRAPLRGISGFGQALREDCGAELSPAALNYVDRMQRSAQHMDTLLMNLLKYATIGRQPLRREPVALQPVVRAAQALLDREVRERQATIEIRPPLPQVLADVTLLEVIFLNLLSNSLKFVAPGTAPKIEISAETDEKVATISVTDNGVGIPAEAREQIFGMFERYHSDRPGTGIGLAIVHRAVERLEGRIGVEDGPDGRGTRFWFTLPLA